jgi:hypothetical protein
LVFELLSIVGVATLLGTEAFEVVQVQVNLQAVIHIPETDDLPVTMSRTSLRDFLTTETRSGCFFTPPSYHLYLLYRYSTLHDGQQPDTAAAVYIVNHGVNHIEECTRLPPAARETVPRFLPSLDTLYAHIFEKSQSDPHFPDIFSVITLLDEMPSVAEISELIGIGPPEVVRVLASLQPLVDYNHDSPVAVCHISVHEFVATKGRSGRFFILSSYHLKLSYYYFGLNLEHLPRSSKRCSQFHFHWKQFLNETTQTSSDI